jgi:hypothetical protein
MKSTRRVFAALLVLLLLVFSAGWYALMLGPDNPVPWVIFSVWGDMVMVGMAVEQVLGYVYQDGRSLTHAALVVGSSALIWALLFTLLFAGAAWCVRIAQKLLSART